MMTRHITKALCSAAIGVFLSTVCFGRVDPGGSLSADQKAAINDLIDTKLKTLSASQKATVNDLIDTKLKTLTVLIDTELKTFADWQAAKVGDLIDIKLKTLSDA
jgi:hypothetical protein